MRRRLWSGFGFLVLLAIGAWDLGSVPVPSSDAPPVIVDRVRTKPGPLRVGAARVEITPSHSVHLAGFGPDRTSRGVHDPLFVRALVLKTDGTAFGILTADILGWAPGDVAAIKTSVGDLFSADRLLLCATHNHNAPDTLGFWGPLPYTDGRDAHFLRTLRKAGRRALREAFRNAVPAQIRSLASIAPPGVTRNLRIPGFYDPTIAILEARGLDGRQLATLVNYGMHPETLGSGNRTITADFPGPLLARLERELGGQALFVNGACGGMVTADQRRRPDGSREMSFREVNRIGQKLAEAVLRTIRASSRPFERKPALAWERKRLLLAIENPLYRLLFRLHDSKRVLKSNRIPVDVVIGAFGDARFATLPGELLPEPGLRIRNELEGRPVFLFGLAEDELGYLIPSADHGTDRYRYERSWCPGPRACDRLLDAILNAEPGS